MNELPNWLASRPGMTKPWSTKHADQGFLERMTRLEPATLTLARCPEHRTETLNSGFTAHTAQCAPPAEPCSRQSCWQDVGKGCAGVRQHSSPTSAIHVDIAPYLRRRR